MARSSADDVELKRACEASIEGSRHNIVLSIRVAKSRGIFGKSAKLGRHMAKARVIAITTKSKGQKTKAFLRVLKYSNGGLLEPAKLYKLKHLSKVEAIQNDPSGCTFMLGFDNLRSQSVAPPHWTMRNKDDRNRLLLCILNISKEVLGRLPKVVGIDIVEMAIWAKENSTLTTNRTFTEDGVATSVMIQIDTQVTVEKDLLSQAEVDDMEALLGTLYDLANVVPTLAKFYRQASESYDQACTRHINMIIFITFERLFIFARRMEELMVTITPQEIQFQVGMSKADLRKMLKPSLSGLDKTINAMYKKLQKNLTSEELLPSLWEKCKKDFLDKYGSFVKLVNQIYPGENVPPVSEMRELLAQM